MKEVIDFVVSTVTCILMVGGTVCGIEGIRFYAGDLIRKIRSTKIDPRLEAERPNFRRMMIFAPPALLLGCLLAIAHFK